MKWQNLSNMHPANDDPPVMLPEQEDSIERFKGETYC
jgi:hypothetical protein